MCVPLNLHYSVCIIVPTLQCVYHCTYTTVCVPLAYTTVCVPMFLHYGVFTIVPTLQCVYHCSYKRKKTVRKWLRAGFSATCSFFTLSRLSARICLAIIESDSEGSSFDSTDLEQLRMPQCCSCGNRGRCRNCPCVKNGRLCSNRLV